MESSFDEYENEGTYEDAQQEGQNINSSVQQSMKHFRPTNKILSKYVDKIDLSPYSPRSGYIDDGKYRSNKFLIHEHDWFYSSFFEQEYSRHNQRKMVRL